MVTILETVRASLEPVFYSSFVRRQEENQDLAQAGLVLYDTWDRLYVKSTPWHSNGAQGRFRSRVLVAREGWRGGGTFFRD